MDETRPPDPGRKTVRALTRRALPWLSLTAGVIGAAIMDRGTKRAGFVAVIALLVWGLVPALSWVQAQAAGRPGRFWGIAAFSWLAATQWAVQLALMFSLPFYLYAATLDPGHVVFVAAIAAVALGSLWDPWTERWLGHPRAGPVLPAIASFVALGVALPALGFSNRIAVWGAAGITAAGATTTSFVFRKAGGRHPMDVLIAGVAVLAALGLGGIRLVPAVPLRLMHADIGTGIAGRDVVHPVRRLARKPGKLVCATAIWAPMGLRDELLHVWRRDGTVTDRIPLSIRGGRTEGFRTWSIKRNFGDDPVATWTCSVETESGQRLGTRAVEIEG